MRLEWISDGVWVDVWIWISIFIGPVCTVPVADAFLFLYHNYCFGLGFSFPNPTGRGFPLIRCANAKPEGKITSYLKLL